MSCNFYLDFLCLVGIASVAGLGIGSVATPGSASVSDFVRSCVDILSTFFTGNNLLLKLLRTFSLALNNNTMLFIYSVSKLVCIRSASPNGKYLSCISHKKQYAVNNN